MAVVKNNYIPRNKYAFVKAKQTLIYNETRKSRDKEKIILTLFNYDGEVSEEQAIAFLHSKPKGWYYWRIMISPDPGEKEDLHKDLDMRELTRKTIQSLETYLKMEGQINFVAALHTDRAHRHVHAIIYLPRLTKEQFAGLSFMPRNVATEEALFQREILDLYQRLQQSRQKSKLPENRELEKTPYSRPLIGMAGGRVSHSARSSARRFGGKIRELCPDCGAPVKFKNGKKYCRYGHVQERGQGLSL